MKFLKQRIWNKFLRLNHTSQLGIEDVDFLSLAQFHSFLKDCTSEMWPCAVLLINFTELFHDIWLLLNSTSSVCRKCLKTIERKWSGSNTFLTCFQLEPSIGKHSIKCLGLHLIISHLTIQNFLFNRRNSRFSGEILCRKSNKGVICDL